MVDHTYAVALSLVRTGW